MKRSPFDAIVIGAGAAGLAAARDLSLAGMRLLHLEARPRIGGRILTLRPGARRLPVELGAEFIHGDAPESLALASAGGLIVDRLSGATYQSRNGRFHTALDFWGKVERFAARLERRFARAPVPDQSFLQAVASSRLAPQDRELLLQYSRGFQGADPRLLSARSMAGAGAEASDHQYRLVSGQDALLDQLRTESDAECIDLRLETIVTDIHWSPGRVRVHARSASGEGDQDFQARALVIAVPHAVLKAGAIRFRPAPRGVNRALRQLEVGQVFKIVLAFKTLFWDENDFVRDRLRSRSQDPETLGFLQAPGEDVPVWWTADPARTPILTGWAGGPDAVPLLALDQKAQVERSLQSLSRSFSIPRSKLDHLLDRWWISDWGQDPYSRGAYSYVRVGGSRAPQSLARPVRDTLFFAGDFLDLGTLGTVEGALGSGRRAARALLRTRS